MADCVYTAGTLKPFREPQAKNKLQLKHPPLYTLNLQPPVP